MSKVPEDVKKALTGDAARKGKFYMDENGNIVLNGEVYHPDNVEYEGEDDE